MKAGENKADVIGKGKDEVVSVMELYSDDVAPTVQPVLVESKHTLEIPDCLPVVAIIDLIDNKKIIRDAKITGKSKSQSDADNSLQFTIYSMVFKDLFGTMPNGIAFDNFVTTKTPKYNFIETQRTENDFNGLVNVVKSVQDAIGKGVFLPASEGSWVCSPKFCGFYHICRYKK